MNGIEITGVGVTLSYSAPVAKTGQTGCWDASGTSIPCTGTKQDGEYQKGVAWPNPRFTDNGDGTITDNLTKLMWLKNANFADTAGYDPDKTGNGTVSWQNGLNFVANLNSESYEITVPGRCGYTDWRLPNRFELESLLELQYYNPALSNTAGTGKWSAGDPFTGVKSSSYWSSTTHAANSTRLVRVPDRRQRERRQ